MRCQGGQNQTCSSGGIWQTTGTSTIQLLANPNFDGTAAAWTVGRGIPSIEPAPTFAGFPVAHTAPNVLLEGDYEDAKDDMFQSVTIPAGATSMTLSFYAFVDSFETGALAYDYMTAYISNPNGQNPVGIVQINDLTFTSTWTLFSGPISTTWAGKSVEIGFFGENNDLDHTLFMIDSAALTVTACPP
jgi:hypothetical protein